MSSVVVSDSNDGESVCCEVIVFVAVFGLLLLNIDVRMLCPFMWCVLVYGWMLK